MRLVLGMNAPLALFRAHVKRALPLLLAIFAAVSAAATAPQPVAAVRLEWRAPETLVVVVDSRLTESFDATLTVTADGARKILEVPVTIRPGETLEFATLRIDEPAAVEVRAAVRRRDSDLILLARTYIRRDASGETRQMSDAEVEAMFAEQHAAMQARAEMAEMERMRAHVRRVIARGGRPACSEEAAPLWNRAVVEELGEAAPASCRERTGS